MKVSLLFFLLLLIGGAAQKVLDQREPRLRSVKIVRSRGGYCE
jgi:hypothetical protein